MSECTEVERRRGLVLPCMIYHMDNVTSRQCREMLDRLEPLIFTDYELVYKFVEHCNGDISKLSCGRTAYDESNQVHGYRCT